MKKLTQERLLLSLFIIILSIIYGLPHIIMIHKLGSKYNPISLTKNPSIPLDEGYAYASYPNHILKGNFPFGESLVYEYRNFPTPYIGETVPATIMAFLAKLVGSIPNAFLVADFVFPPMIFVLLYLVSKSLIKNSLFALTATFFTVISRDFILLFPNPKALLDYFSVANNDPQFLYLSRAIHPQITFPIFLLAFICLFKLSQDPQNNTLKILSGILFGLLFYSYFFYWTYFSCFFAVVFIFALIKRNYLLTKALLIYGFIALAISSFYFLTIFEFYHLNFAKDFTEKIASQTNPFNLVILRVLLVAIPFRLLYKKSDASFLFLFLVVGFLMIPASKFILGRDLESFHYLRRAAIPFLTIAFFAVLYKLIDRKKIILTFVSFSIILLTLFFGIKNQIIAANNYANELIFNKGDVEVMKWLKENTTPNDVIGTLDLNLNYLIPVYALNYIYYPPIARTITPTDEEVERFIVLVNLLNIDTNSQKKILDENLEYMYHAKIFQRASQSPLIIKKATETVENFEKNENWLSLSRKYKLNYIIHNSQSLSINPRADRLRIITTVDKYLIFKVQ